MNFPFETNGKFIILGVPILKHIRVFCTVFVLDTLDDKILKQQMNFMIFDILKCFKD